MTRARNIVVNSATVVCGKVLTSLITAGAMMFVARKLGTGDYGKISIALAYLMLFQIISQFGVDSIFVRQISQQPEQRDKWLANAFVCKVVFASAALVLSWLMLAFFSYSLEIKLLICIASFSMLFSFSSLIPGMFQSELRTACYVVPDIIMSLAVSAMIVGAALLKLHIAVIIAVQSLAIIPLTCIYIYAALKYLGVRCVMNLDMHYVRYLVRESIPLFLSSLLIALSLRLDQIVLFSAMNETALGLYAAAVRIVEVPNFIPTSLLSVVYPVLSLSHVRSATEFNNICDVVFKYMSIIGLPLAIGTALMSGEIILTVYGRDFRPASTPLAILSFSIIFVFLGSAFSTVLMATGLQRYITLFTLYGAVLSCVLYIWLIPKYGEAGAAFATSLSYSGFGMLPAFLIKKTRCVIIKYYMSLLRCVPAAAVMSLCIYFMNGLHPLLIVSAAICVYLVALTMTKVLNVSDFRLLSGLWSAPKKQA